MPIIKSNKCFICEKPHVDIVYDCFDIITDSNDYGEYGWDLSNKLCSYTTQYGICNECLNVEIPKKEFSYVSVFSKKEQSVKNKFIYLAQKRMDKKIAVIPIIPEEFAKIKTDKAFREYTCVTCALDGMKDKIFRELIKTGKWEEYNNQEIPENLR